jgi:ABC-type glycerol-3-phosphate transport system permease component
VAYWLLRGFLARIPVAIHEAAWIDGAGYWQALLRISLPLLAAGRVAAGLICRTLAYKEFLFSALFAPDASVRGLTVVISLFPGGRSTISAKWPSLRSQAWRRST